MTGKYGASRWHADSAPPDREQDHRKPWLPVWLSAALQRSSQGRNIPLIWSNRWAQQGSNLRPLACKASSYRRWTWLGVAWCGICQR
jgi:hypothetical protein